MEAEYVTLMFKFYKNQPIDHSIPTKALSVVFHLFHFISMKNFTFSLSSTFG